MLKDVVDGGGNPQVLGNTWSPLIQYNVDLATDARLRPDGTIVPRNGFVGDPVHRVDVRLQERIPIGGRVRLDGILEVFNLFDRANFGSYETDELSPLFGQPEFNNNLAFAPRTLQLGFRVTF